MKQISLFDSGLAFGKGISDQHMGRLENAFQAPRSEGEFRDRALFKVLSRTGLRASGLLSLCWSRVIQTPEGKSAIIYEKKGGTLALAIPGDEALTAVREYQEAAGLETDLFFWSLPNRAFGGRRTRLSVRSLERIVHGWGNRFQITTGKSRINNRTRERTNTLHVHALRHSVIQKTFDQFGSIAAQKIAGHTSPLTTSRFYTRGYFDASQALQWSAV